MLLPSDLDSRTQEIFRCLVDAYLETGEPIGSHTLSRRIGLSLSSATIRHIMANLEDAGLLYAPHVSAGRLPTDTGMSLFVRAFLEIGNIPQEEQERLAQLCTSEQLSPTEAIEEVTTALSELSGCVGLVLAPKREAALRHIEFIYLSSERALVIMVADDDTVENRIINIPPGLPASVLTEVTNYLNTRIIGKTLKEAWALISTELVERRIQLNELTRKLVEVGGAAKPFSSSSLEYVVVRGQGNLLRHVREDEDFMRLRRLFSILETREALARLLEATIAGEGVQIFMGKENTLFTYTGCSVIVAPCVPEGEHKESRIIGVVGVVGPTRMNYSRIIPLVDFTSRVVGRLLEGME
jgi:heat-inducible transcriptional repressor